METIKLTERLDLHLEYKKTRSGFKHTADLVQDGWKHLDSVKICYQNRTWESYTFESVIEKLFEKTKHLTEEEKPKFLAQIKAQKLGQVKKEFSLVAAVAKMGEVLLQDQQKENEWKKRMLKAGLPGLDFPDDWDELSEEVKAERLDRVVKTLE